MVVRAPEGLDDPAALEAARELAARAAAEGRCFVGHPATAALLGVAPCRGEARPKPGDAATVIRLRRRAAVPGDVEVTPADLEMIDVFYLPLSSWYEEVAARSRG